MNQHKTTHQNQQRIVCNRKFQLHGFENDWKVIKIKSLNENLSTIFVFINFWPSHNFFVIFWFTQQGFSVTFADIYRHKWIFCRKLFDDRESFRFHSQQTHDHPKHRKRLTEDDLWWRVWWCSKSDKLCKDTRRKSSMSGSWSKMLACLSVWASETSQVEEKDEIQNLLNQKFARNTIETNRVFLIFHNLFLNNILEDEYTRCTT